LAQKLGVWIADLDDKRYPPALKQIYDPPPVLCIKGSFTRQDNLAISIVGSRHCSLYGQEQSSRLAHFLSSNGGLYIGAGKNLEEGSFFSGLIDDVRIYNVALSSKEIEELAR
jgi:predicted Rossmann fold nucleotide-binding protein DprA/Smf involved in DNA uptake